MLDSDRADQILAYLEKYEYASRPHVVLTLMWHTMMRVGEVHALDCLDYDPANRSLEIIHRPETGTTLKNQKQGERFVALSDEVGELLDDWLENTRPAVTDEHGRILVDKRIYTRRTRITPFDEANGGSPVNRFHLISSTSINH
jgi:integrase